MPKLYAQPYSVEAVGFYFDDLEEYEKKVAKSDVEEFEIQFIDGDHDELDLFKALGVTQANLEDYFDVLLDAEEGDVTAIKILMVDMGYDFDDAWEKKDDLVVYGRFDDDEEFAQELVDGLGGLGQVSRDTLEMYFDWESYARDLMMEQFAEQDGVYYDSSSV